jgi:hypothetical protein
MSWRTTAIPADWYPFGPGTFRIVNRRSLIVPAAATVGLSLPLVVLDRRMRAAGGFGMLAFEVSGPDRGAEILRAWGVEGQRAARASLLLDFPFLVTYTVLNVRLTARTTDALSGSGGGVAKRMASVVVAVQVAAGACDAVENVALLGVVARRGDARLSTVARRAALVKFAGLIVGWLYDAVAVLRRRHRASDAFDRLSLAKLRGGLLVTALILIVANRRASLAVDGAGMARGEGWG